MKMNIPTPSFEHSDGMLDKFFSIGDHAMVFDVLRSKLYSNPILAICREISCNARDAHREVGKFNEPIIITLPTALEPNYKIKDFGTGISPDRIENIFVKYGTSTKRDSDTQLGFFGLGSKTPFSYTDQFAVTTVHNSIKYSYVCSIDSTRIGKITLLDKRSTDAPNGTEISIGVKPTDFKLFAQWTEQACRHWTVRPKIVAGIINWQEITPKLKKDGWNLISGNWDRSILIIIDGIEYSLDNESIKKIVNIDLIESLNDQLVMNFKMGEISLSANREQIYLDKLTRDKIADRINSVSDEIRKIVKNKLDKFDNLWKANVGFRQEISHMFRETSQLSKQLMWKNYPLNQYYCNLDCSVVLFKKREINSYKRPTTNYIPKYRFYKLKDKKFSFTEKSQLCINDLGIPELTPRHVKKLFDANDKLEKVYIICPNDKVSEQDLNNSMHLDQMQPIRLSSIIKVSAFKKYTAPTSRILIFKFANGEFCQNSFESMREDKNLKVFCKLNKNVNLVKQAIINNNVVDTNILQILLDKNSNISLFGVDKEIDFSRLKKINNSIEIEEYIAKLINENKINLSEVKFAIGQRSNFFDSFTFETFNKIAPLILQNSLFLDIVKLQKELDLMTNSYGHLVSLFELLKGEIKLGNYPNFNLRKMKDDFYNKYPLLAITSTYGMRDCRKGTARYINLIDKYGEI